MGKSFGSILGLFMMIDTLAGSAFYTPGPFGFEKEIAKRLAWWEDLRRRAQDTGDADDTKKQ